MAKGQVQLEATCCNLIISSELMEEKKEKDEIINHVKLLLTLSSVHAVPSCSLGRGVSVCNAGCPQKILSTFWYILSGVFVRTCLLHVVCCMV